MVHGSDLTMQKLKTVFGTQKGEWFLDWERGINRNDIFGKQRPTDEEIKAELQDGASQVDENFVIDELTTDYDKQKRELYIHCTAVNHESEEEIVINELI